MQQFFQEPENLILLFSTIAVMLFSLHESRQDASTSWDKQSWAERTPRPETMKSQLGHEHFSVLFCSGMAEEGNAKWRMNCGM
jgi:hypothetical protein